MPSRFRPHVWNQVAALLACLLASAAVAQTPLDATFTYQGRLAMGGAAATGVYDLEFRLYDAESGGALVGGLISKPGVAVSNGLFAVMLNFGPSTFGGQKRWLEIGVKPGGSASPFTVLSPRFELTPSPYSVFSAKAGDATTIAGLACGSGEVPKWSGTGWTCGTDSLGSGTVQSVATGAGLTGGPITLGGTISVAAGGIVSSMIANGAVGSAQIAIGAVNASHVDPSQIQVRVTGECPPGTTVLRVTSNGQLECAEPRPLAGFAQAVLDGSGDVGQNTSIVHLPSGDLVSYYDVTHQALKILLCPSVGLCSTPTPITTFAQGAGRYSSLAAGLDGRGVIAFQGSPTGSLVVAHCSDVPCTVLDFQTGVDGASGVGQYVSLAVGGDGFPIMSYYDATNGDLKVVHCSDATCSSRSASVLDTVGDVGRFTSLRIGSDGLGLIAYYDVTNGDLKIAHCSNPACSTATLAALDTAGDVGQYAALSIGGDGLGLVGYYDATNGDLKVAHCMSVVCSSATTATRDSAGDVGQYVSAVTGIDGFALLAYQDVTNADLKVAHCSNADCSASTNAARDLTGSVGAFTSTTLGSTNLGAVAYYDATVGALKLLRCGQTACTSASSVVADGEVVGQFASATIGVDGLGIIAYHDATHVDLRVAHCVDAPCATATVSVLESTGNVGSHASIIGGRQSAFPGNLAGPTIVFDDAGGTFLNHTLKVDLCENNECAGLAFPAAPAGTARRGQYGSVAIGTDGLPLMTSYDSQTLDLTASHCGDASCFAASSVTLDSAGDVGRYTSLAIGADGLGLVSYYDVTNANLKVAHCLDAACGSAAATTLDSTGTVGEYTSLAVGSDGLGIIAYHDGTNGDLKVAHCSNAACTAASLATLDSTGVVGQFTSIAIGVDGLALISYYDVTNADLKVAHCSNVACSSASIFTLDNAGDVGQYSSITIGRDGLALIAYHDATLGALKVTHCSNALCQPFVRRR